jgi:hypothetical protein
MLLLAALILPPLWVSIPLFLIGAILAMLPARTLKGTTP